MCIVGSIQGIERAYQSRFRPTASPQSPISRAVVSQSASARADQSAIDCPINATAAGRLGAPTPLNRMHAAAAAGDGGSNRSIRSRRRPDD